ARVVLNRVGDGSWRDVERFIQLEYALRVIARLPLADDWWRTLERQHSLVPFCAPVLDVRRHQRAYGDEAWRTSKALEEVARRLLPEQPAALVAGLEVS